MKHDQPTAGADGGAPFGPGVVLEGRYRLVRRLGEGGMGAVWLAQQLALEREVAVKVLHVAGPVQRSRLRREALALAAVRHAAVVQVHDYGEAGGEPYIVMELLQGEPLAARLGRAGAMSAPEAAALLLPLLDGLTAAHRAGVVHRDIKPENVILAEGGAPKLVDFGIARLDRASRPDTDTIEGTPAYMAPEQVRGLAAGERVDVWGAAVLLYELMAGVTPFAVDDVFATMRRILEDPPPFPRHASGLDGRLWAILTEALRKDPADRTPTAAALRALLATWLEGRPRSAPPAAAAGADRFAPTLPAEAITPLLPAEAITPPLPADDAPPSLDALIREKFGA